ncbi:glycosyltransferase involved in cell wall biosynthesis [Caulobacter rhizosphaerae]|uniref:Glycosyltransferase involved in cell wall biosynthesis n=1 Tax=Caulobacter rhizosphaerae TaxID=2010972 RepID=A0ABU1MYR4_9CAUL|nr:glycosyltransferase [Caulobacter rhizosphaerae]MDR6531238.1 glycosyltransferase involved in cell wall biosynthesis [Caulobacter rhizosphaerae]
MGDGARTIVIVLHDLPLGGSERIAVRLANRWAALGRKVTLFCGSREGPLAQLIDAEVQLVEADPPLPRGPGSRKALGRAAAAYVARSRPDILFAPGNYHWPILPAIDALPADQRPGVVAQIGTPLYRHGRGALAQIPYNLRTRRQFAGVDQAISLSDSMTEDANHVLGRRITQRIALPALDDDHAFTPPPEGKLILAAGRLVAEKGFDVALRAFARLDDPDARLAIVGEGERRTELETLAIELGVAERVSLPGYVPDIRPWLEAARAFLLTSWYEGYAAVIVEALGAGRPVVSTDCTPAARELLGHSDAGRVAAIGDVDGLAEGLRQVLSAPAPDPAVLARSVAGYRIGPIAEAYLQVFDAVVAKRASPAAIKRFAPLPGRAFSILAGRPAPASAARLRSAWRRSA